MAEIRLHRAVIVVIILILLAGCADFTPATDNESTDTSTSGADIDTSGDGIPDQTATELGLNPDQEYDEQFVKILEEVEKEDKDAARSFADHFATEDGLSDSADTTLDNYSKLLSEHPEKIDNLSTELLSGSSQDVVDKQISVLREIETDKRDKILEEHDLGDEDWSNSGLTNWEELHYSTDILKVDTSGDGIPDGASVNYEERYPDADPLQKDIYVEINTVPGADIQSNALEAIEQEFADAPVENPDGSEGINIHFIENKEIDDDGWEMDPEKVAQESEYDDLGYHYVVIVQQGDLSSEDAPDDLGEVWGVSYEGIASNIVEDQGGDRTGSILMHELGHSLGLGDDLDGVDSTELSHSQYSSVMNYNSPDNYYGFSDGSDSKEGTYDWQLIECKLAHTTYTQMSQSGDDSLPIETYNALGDEVTHPRDCVLGFEITDQDAEYVFISTDDSPTAYEDENDIVEFIEELREDFGEYIEYTISDKPEQGQRVTHNVTVTNTGLYEKTQTVEFKPDYGLTDVADTQSKEISLKKGEEKTVTFELNANTLQELDEYHNGFEITTQDDDETMIVASVSDE